MSQSIRKTKLMLLKNPYRKETLYPITTSSIVRKSFEYYADLIIKAISLYLYDFRPEKDQTTEVALALIENALQTVSGKSAFDKLMNLEAAKVQNAENYYLYYWMFRSCDPFLQIEVLDAIRVVNEFEIEKRNRRKNKKEV